MQTTVVTPCCLIKIPSLGFSVKPALIETNRKVFSREQHEKKNLSTLERQQINFSFSPLLLLSELCISSLRCQAAVISCLALNTFAIVCVCSLFSIYSNSWRKLVCEGRQVIQCHNRERQKYLFIYIYVSMQRNCQQSESVCLSSPAGHSQDFLCFILKCQSDQSS